VSLRPATSYAAVLGFVIGEARRRAGVTQSQLAAAVNLSQATWSRVEGGRFGVTVEHLALAAWALSTHPGLLARRADALCDWARGRGVEVIAGGPITAFNERVEADLRLLFNRPDAPAGDA
jgi:transcriptional regulator with XRE-family HTH domain